MTSELVVLCEADRPV